MDDFEILTFEGFIKYYKYNDAISGYKIASFKIDDNKQERNIIIVGYFPSFSYDEALVVKCHQINHPKYGIQFEVIDISRRIPTSKENIIRFLSSSSFKGIGKKKATKIYETLGDETISLLINEPESYNILKSNKIINDNDYDSLHLGLKEFDFKSNAFVTLLKNGFSLKNIMKCESTYGEDLINIIDNNPYQLILDIDGIGFKTVDKLALSMGIDKNDIRRIKACILYQISNICNNLGDSYTFINRLYESLKKVINDVEFDLYYELLKALESELKIVIVEEKVYDKKIYDAEYNIIKSLKPFINRKFNSDRLINSFDEMIKVIEEDNGIEYSNEQLNAIFNALSNGLFIITGGPGTGKTTILNAIIKLLKMLYGDNVNLSLCAPTGRASKRMSILSNNYACTIHRLLKWDLHSNTFTYNKENKLTTDVIIIDEFSMVDTLLFNSLLDGTQHVSQIILIGDDNQIPSVSSGNLLHDLLQIEKIKNIKLNYIYRQENDSSIVNLAYKIRNKELDESFNFKEDVKFFKVRNIECSNFIINILKNAFDKGFTFDDFQIIIPLYAGVAGIDNINAKIQEWYNPYDPSKPEVRVGHQIIRINDRVLQLKNQPEDDIFNGDIGTVIEIDKEKDEIYVEFDSGVVSYPSQLHSNLTLSYAISIHKAQGSEFEFVILPIYDDFGFFLNKQLIYTAISRAKRQLFIIGSFHTFIYKSMVENKNIRKTTLIERSKEIL